MPRVLVVDDHDDARELLAMIIGLRGYAVVTASNGLEAIEEARRERPDAIIMDLFMPIMDGYEATRVLKTDPLFSSVPIIAYTARSGASEMDSGLFAACCVKPCHPDELLGLIDNVLASGVHPNPSLP